MMVAGCLAALGVVVSVGTISADRRFRKRGYRAWFAQPGQFLYEEWDAGGAMRRISFDVKQVALGHARATGWEIALPSEGAWDERVPAWARGRRAELMERTVEALGGGTQILFSDAGRP
jgi:hypothetical protein